MDSEAKKILSGIAGEYFVAGELSRRGYIASITLRNTASIDILASNGERTVNIQVKTRCIEKSDNWNFGGSPLKYKEIINKIFYHYCRSMSQTRSEWGKCTSHVYGNRYCI